MQKFVKDQDDGIDEERFTAFCQSKVVLIPILLLANYTTAENMSSVIILSCYLLLNEIFYIIHFTKHMIFGIQM